MHDRVGGVAAKDHPGLGLAPRAAEVVAGEVAVRVAVDGQALASVQQLDQQRRVVAVGLGVAPAQEALRVGVDRLAERPAGLQAGQALAARPERGRGRADPVLRKERTPRLRERRRAARRWPTRPGRSGETGWRPTGSASRRDRAGLERRGTTLQQGQLDRHVRSSFPPIRWKQKKPGVHPPASTRQHSGGLAGFST